MQRTEQHSGDLNRRLRTTEQQAQSFRAQREAARPQLDEVNQKPKAAGKEARIQRKQYEVTERNLGARDDQVSSLMRRIKA